MSLRVFLYKKRPQKYFFAGVSRFLNSGMHINVVIVAILKLVVYRENYNYSFKSQFMGDSPFLIKKSLVFEKCLQPKNPLNAESGLG